MKYHIECYACTIKQAVQIARLSNMDEQTALELLEFATAYLNKNIGKLSAPVAVGELYSFARSLMDNNGSFDPFFSIKKRTNSAALKLQPELEKIISDTDHPFTTSLKIAAAGNIIDFGIMDHGKLDIKEEISRISSLKFTIFDYNSLRKSLEKAKRLVYVGDNAGEIVFDKICITELKREYPGLSITFIVRGKPVLNDVCMQDAKDTGMDKVCPVVSSGSMVPGTIPHLLENEAKNLFEEADVIISKGQGNFETLCEWKKSNLYFILRTKCNVVAENLGTSLDDLVLKQHNPDKE